MELFVLKITAKILNILIILTLNKFGNDDQMKMSQFGQI